MKWTQEQFYRGAIRKRSGRPSQDDYKYWGAEELAIVESFKKHHGGYRLAAQLLGRSYQSVKAKGAQL